MYKISRIVEATYRLANRSIINAINRSHFENLSWRNMKNNPIINPIIKITPTIVASVPVNIGGSLQAQTYSCSCVEGWSIRPTKQPKSK